MPKTGLCNIGILAFNTGLVDPGYTGRISTIAINFSRSPIRLKPGEPFARLVLHDLEPREDHAADVSVGAGGPSDDELKGRSTDYPPTFLDVPGQAERLIREVTNDVVDRQRNAALLLISVIGFMFVMWNFASFFLLSRQANILAERPVQSEVRAMDFARLQLQVDSLQRTVRGLPHGLLRNQRTR